MSEMIERMCAAFNAKLAEMGELAGVEYNNEQQREAMRAALAVMREPTEAMKRLDASLGFFWDHSTAPPVLSSKIGSHMGASYQEMIDEALR